MSSDQEDDRGGAGIAGVSLYRAGKFRWLGVALVRLRDFSSYFAFSLRPWANSNLRQKLYETQPRRGPAAGLKEKKYSTVTFPGAGRVYRSDVGRGFEFATGRADFRCAPTRISRTR